MLSGLLRLKHIRCCFVSNDMWVRLVFVSCFLQIVSCYIGFQFYLHDLSIENVYGPFNPIYTDECRDLNLVTQLYKTIYSNNQIQSLYSLLPHKILPATHPGYTEVQVLKNIRYLSFTDCDNNSIGRDVIQNLPNLETLALKRDSIGVIPPKVFYKIPVKQLDFSENIIVSLENDVFVDLPNLERLFLFQNKINAWNPQCISNVPKLLVLDLANNELEEIPQNAFTAVTNLKWLSLMTNRIKNLHYTSFWQLKHLEILDLRNNHIQILPTELFLPLKRLRLLFLHNNQLVYIEENHLNNLIGIQFLTFDSNPWQCACYDAIVRWGNRNSVTLFKPKCNNETSLVCTISWKKCQPIYDINKVMQFRANTKMSKCFIEPENLYSYFRKAGIGNDLNAHINSWLQKNTS